MTVLTDEAVASYRHHGYYYPLEGIGKAHAGEARRDLEEYERQQGGTLTRLGPQGRYKLHVRLPWAHRVASHPAVLDAVEALIGPDILIFTSTIFIKEPQTQAVTLWHQDAAYFGLRPHEHTTAWIALSEASQAAGCMAFLSEAGAGRLHTHKPNMDPQSINAGGQTIVGPFETASAVRASLGAGQFSVHHTLCIHSSPPNGSDDRRIGIGVSFVPTRVKHIGTIRQRAMLVRGTDAYGHFDLEPAPGEHAAINEAEHSFSIARFNAAYAEQIEWHAQGRTEV